MSNGASENGAPSTSAQYPSANRRPTKHRTVRQKWRAVSLNNKLIVVFSGVTTLATFAYTIVAGWTLSEIRNGSTDTHALAVAAASEADRMKDLADRMKDQADRTKTIADQAIIQAEASQTSSSALIGTNRAWMVPISYTQEVAPIAVTFSNAGKSPAINLVEKAEYATRVVSEEAEHDSEKVSALRDGCEHLESVQGKTMQSLVAGGDAAAFTLGNLPSEWVKPITANYGYKTLTIHGCLWYQDTLTNQQRSTEFWLQAASFKLRNAPYNEASALVNVYLHNGTMFIFH